MDDRFFHAFAFGEFSLLGRKLKDFSMWHTFLLEALGNPFIGDVENVSLIDLFVISKVCTCQYPDKPGIKPTFIDTLRMWRIRGREKAITREVERVLAYLEDHTTTPQFWKNDKAGVGGGYTAPEILTTICYLITQGIPEERAWNMSVGQARWYEATFLERGGAELSFLYDFQVSGENNLPEENLSDDEVFSRAVEELGQEQAEHWFESRN